MQERSASKESNSSEEDVSDTSSQRAAEEDEKIKCDAVYGILESWQHRIKVKQRVEHKTQKLMQRMDLDRPILQREKFEMIMLEKMINDKGEFERQDREMKVHKIRNAMVDRMKQRRIDNQNQLLAYKHLCEFLRNRYTVERVNLSRVEISLMEVIKKIVEIGWIITETEMS